MKIKMEENKEIKNIYDELTEENKEILNMVAKGMQIAQENKKEG